jgi:organic hydroperoxide reductase OsmC/OhrA
MDHHFSATVEWLGNRGTGTSSYKAYGRENVISAEGKPPIEGSSARVFHGNRERWNPEELLIAALSECHMLSYLHVAASHSIVVTSYSDTASGTMRLRADNGGQFTQVTLRPEVTIESGDVELAVSLHREASEKCFIAASVNFPVHHEPTVRLDSSLSED